MRTVDTQEYLNAIEDILDSGKSAVIPVSGISMAPFLQHKRDFVELQKNRTYTKGDIVLYTRPSGQYVLHRIIKVEKDSFLICGDNSRRAEVIESKHVYGRVIRARRKGKWYAIKHPLCRCYTFVYSRPGLKEIIFSILSRRHKRLRT